MIIPKHGGTNKELKAAIGAQPMFIETSMFGPEFKGYGAYTVVGPDPHVRKWYATIHVKDGLISRVE